jgi:molybdate transport system substrate-binding protein
MRRFAVLLSCLLLAVCAFAHQVTAQDQRLLVFAAASLKDALDEINATYKQATGIDVVASYAGSSQLIKQIEHGAPADIFISADIESMDYGFEKKIVRDGTRIDLLGNRLVLIAPASENVSNITINPGLDLAALAGKGRIAIGDIRSVPAGRYAQAALQELALWTAVQPKLAMVENVRVALALVAREEAPLGIVYETDARAEPKVKAIGAFPANSHPPIIYPAALTASAKAGAAAYLEFLQSPATRAIFEKRGFTILTKPS